MRKCLIDIDTLKDGSIAVTLYKNSCVHLAKFRIPPTSASVFLRSWEHWRYDADAYFHAVGMSDAEAFDSKTWK